MELLRQLNEITYGTHLAKYPDHIKYCGRENGPPKMSIPLSLEPEKEIAQI